ncbi:DUF397 domain-containing protein [Embleya sp. NPDC005971]|uniref:DUF397 domain-containing protein n=1 Tax=Embleya sp. NPDC005971 TaxID=3156724 RepID=UPI0033F032D7
MSTAESAWVKSSYSGTQGDNCVEVAVTEQAIRVRDSKDRTRALFAVRHAEWAPFIHAMRQDRALAGRTL